MDLKNSDRLIDFWNKEPEKIKVYHGMITNITAGETLIAGQIAMLNGNMVVGIALESGKEGDIIPVMMHGIVKMGGELRRI